MNCKTCGKHFHYCQSCDIDKYMSIGYCNKKCFENSEEYKMYYTKLLNLWSSLNDFQKSELWALWDNGILIDDAYEETIDSVIQRER